MGPPTVADGAAEVNVMVCGAACGVTLFDAADGALVPMALMATTVQVTATPFVSPVTVIGDVSWGGDEVIAPQVAV